MNHHAAATVLAATAILGACAAPLTSDSRAGASPRCVATALTPVFITQADEASKVLIHDSLGQVSAVLASGAFAEACRQSSMNRTGAHSVDEVCEQLACAGAREVKIGIYADPSMKTFAFEKRGAVFINTAKSRGGKPGNLAHEFAHTLGYTHSTYWGILKKQSVPYVVGALVDRLVAVDLRAADPIVPADDAADRGLLDERTDFLRPR